LYFPQFAYGKTKAALEQITTSMAADLALRKVPIRINAIQSGIFPTDIAPAEVYKEYKTKAFPGFIAPVPTVMMGKVSHCQLSHADPCEPDLNSLSHEQAQGDSVDGNIPGCHSTATGYTNGIVLKVDGGISMVNP